MLCYTTSIIKHYKPFSPQMMSGKLVLLGESGTGKSCIAVRLVKKHFKEDTQATLGAAFMAHTMQINDQ